MRPSTRREILDNVTGNCQLLTDGFESRYGHLQIYKNNRMDTYCIVKDLKSRDLKDFEAFANYLQWKSVQANRNIASLVSYSKEYDGVSRLYGYTLSMEFFPEDLQKRIVADLSVGVEVEFYKKVAKEESVWYVIDTLIRVSTFYRNFGLVHGDIQPWTVHINKANEILVIDNPLLFPKYGDCFSKGIANPAYSGTFSPLQLDALARGQKYVNHDKWASEVWSIGLTALSYASMRDISCFYNWNIKQLIYESILFEINRLSNFGYSKVLINLLKHMLVLDETQRPTFDMILSCTSSKTIGYSLQNNDPYEIKIKRIDSFESKTLM